MPAFWRPRPAQARPWRAGLPIAVLLALTPIAAAQDEEDRPHRFGTGAYSFSDELGGFRILSATGAGTTPAPTGTEAATGAGVGSDGSGRAS